MNRYNVDVHLRNGNKFFITTNSFASSATIYLSKLLSNENGDFIIIDDIYRYGICNSKRRNRRYNLY